MLNSGNSILVVSVSEDKPSAILARVERTAPLTVLVPAKSDPETSGLEPGDRVTLIMPSQDADSYAEASVTTVTRYGLSHLVELEAEPFVRFDRRRSERYDVALPGMIGTVSNGLDTAPVSHFPITVTNLSLVGAWVKSEIPLQQGSLVTLAIDDTMHGDEFKMLGLVSRVGNDGQGAGIEFFDFIGSSRFRLANYLRGLPRAA